MNMAPLTPYLPSRRFIGIVSVIVLTVAGYFLYIRTHHTIPDTTPTPENTITNVPEGYDQYADDDNDGLANWEEAMWGTNTNAIDTDGDGTADSVELAQNRNPLVNAPDDSTSTYPVIPSLESADTGYAGRTSGIAQSFASQLYAIGLSGNASSVDGSALLNGLITNELAQGRIKDMYAREQAIVSDGTAETYRAYGNAFGAFITTYTSSGEPYASTEIIKDALTREDLSALSALSPYASALSREATRMAGTPVPSDFLSEHVELVNGLSTMAKALGIMSQSAHDPFMILLGIGEYESAYKRFSAQIDAFATVCATHNIPFSPDEPGYMFIVAK